METEVWKRYFCKEANLYQEMSFSGNLIWDDSKVLKNCLYGWGRKWWCFCYRSTEEEKAGGLFEVNLNNTASQQKRKFRVRDQSAQPRKFTAYLPKNISPRPPAKSQHTVWFKACSCCGLDVGTYSCCVSNSKLSVTGSMWAWPWFGMDPSSVDIKTTELLFSRAWITSSQTLPWPLKDSYRDGRLSFKLFC